MSTNELNLVFGPSIPADLDAVGLAFISAPVLKGDSAVAVLSAERYVKENYPHLRDFPLRTRSTTASSLLFMSYEPTDVLGMYTNAGSGFNFTQAIPGTQDFSVTSLQSPITILGLYQTKAGSWAPLIKPGCVWRYHIIKPEEFDVGTEFMENGAPNPAQVSTQTSWLARSGLKPGDEVLLIYTVPECRYGPLQTNSSTTFPGPQARLRLCKEYGSMISPNKVAYRTPLKVITKITVNGVVRFNGSFDGTSEDDFIKSIHHDIQQIELAQNLSADDVVELETLGFTDSYLYTGYLQQPNSNWYVFDANPEYGHYVGDPRTDTLKTSSSSLLEQITIYCIPSAYAKIQYGTVGENSSVRLNFVSAFSWGETHFVRHIIGQSEEDIQTRQQDGPTNTWGFAVLGRNYYNEASSYPDDVYSLSVPSMMPLGKVVMAAPASFRSVQVADIRERGGGVPVDYPLQAVNTQSSGLDFLRSFLDLGIWEGSVVDEGGAVEIWINSNVLDQYTEDEVWEIVRQHITPGVDFEIIYKDDV